MRFEITYTLKNGTVKTKVMIGKDEKSVTNYFKFKYRHNVDSIVER